jgi:hypothetical protein
MAGYGGGSKRYLAPRANSHLLVLATLPAFICK